MKRIITVLLLMSSFVFGQNPWINEFHYDNAGTDAGEFIEVAGPASTSLAGWTIALYNGSNGEVYGTITLSGSFVDNGTGYGAIAFYEAGIQNGAPDGFALVDPSNNIIEFLSYEGVITATNGPANGMTSTDIGLAEGSSTPIGHSLQLTGEPFVWAGPTIASPGEANSGQVLPVELTTFSASVLDQSVKLNWETATEVNNYGFEVERKYESNAWNKIDFVTGHGNSNSPKYYSYTDSKIDISGKILYRLKQIDIDGTFEYSDEVEVILGSPDKFELNQNFPNPFNPMTSIQFNIPQDSQVRLNVFNVLGEEVAELLNDNILAGYHSVNFDGSHLNSGIYFYKLETNNFTQIRKMMLVK